MEMKMIGRIHTDFVTKFGVPRQSGLVPELMGKIVLEPEYRNPDAFRGLEEFSHLWLVWEFSEAVRPEWSPTVRPPRLGGNRRVGVFATRSPFRPNPIGLSCVKLEQIDLQDSRKPVIWVSGVDMMDGTPIYDIKPYLPYADSHPGAKALRGVLEQDPRPRYQKDPERIYGMSFGEYEVKFTVQENVLRVVELVRG